MVEVLYEFRTLIIEILEGFLKRIRVYLLEEGELYIFWEWVLVVVRFLDFLAGDWNRLWYFFDVKLFFRWEVLEMLSLFVLDL